jgi:hypothetical protein
MCEKRHVGSTNPSSCVCCGLETTLALCICALFEVNPFDGKALRRLDVSGAFPGQVDSAANKKLIGLRQIADMQKSPAVWIAVEKDR